MGSFWSWLVNNNARQYYRNQAQNEANMYGLVPNIGAVDAALMAAKPVQHQLSEPSIQQQLAQQGAQPAEQAPSGYGFMLPSAKRTWDYLNADMAKAYGMSKGTAYQEALLNTAHQREVADLQAAGLNPVLSASGGAGAGSNVSVVSEPSAASGGSGKAESEGRFDVFGVLGGIVEIAGGLLQIKGGSAASGTNNAAKGLKDIGKALNN